MSGIFTSPYRHDRLWGPPNPMGNGASFPEDKAAGAWILPLTFNHCRGEVNVDVYIQSPPDVFMT
jgi:hypothetical protein